MIAKARENIGILAMEIYFPSTYVCQERLGNDILFYQRWKHHGVEVFDSVSTGKYTTGLGQQKMGFCSDREDIHSLCLTVVESLMTKYDISYPSIGRLEVGTETLIDKSKSVKTVLMRLFSDHGNDFIEGVDSKNACYGGTAALFNSIDWIESSAWDGRYALVVAADIAVYDQGPARSTGGAGAVAMLIGPNAPIVMESKTRVTYMSHTYDFYKPNMSSEYAVVDGQLSVECYMGALNACYEKFIEKSLKLGSIESISINSFSHLIFHAPYGKLVQKAFCKLGFNDYIQHRLDRSIPALEKYKDSYKMNMTLDKEAEVASMTAFKSEFDLKTYPSLLCSREIGNLYCGSLYASLLSLICNVSSDDLQGNRIGMFSFGSGFAASFFSIKISGPLNEISKKVNLIDRLDQRREKSPEYFNDIMNMREKSNNLSNFTPIGTLDDISENCFYLQKVDEKSRRMYAKKLSSISKDHCDNNTKL